ncbi:MAG: sodium:solute symporter family protein [Spirochaetales bacterium]
MNLFFLTVIVIMYLGVVSYLGYQGYKKTKSSLDYNLAGRNIHPYIMALSYGATFISTSAIVGFGGTAAQFGFSLLWLTACNIWIGIFVAFVFFGKRTRRMGLNLDAHTFPEFMGKRLGSPFIQRFMGLVIFLTMPLYIAAVLIGASRIMEALLQIDYDIAVILFTVLVAAYVIFGGLKGVMYTDALQGSLMFIGMAVLLVGVYVSLGGITKAHSALSSLSSMVPEGLRNLGMLGWTESPKGGSPLFWILYSSLVLGVGVGVLAQPQLIVRYMTVKSNQELNRAVAIGGIFILTMTGTAFVVGALSNVYFVKTSGKIALAMVGGNVDAVIPKFIAEFMPSWFGYLFMLVILSAAMSTLSSQFHTLGTSLGRDLYSTLRLSKGKEKTWEILVTKTAILLGLIFTVYLAYHLGASVIARATSIFFGLMASCFLAPYAAALYWKRLTRIGAVSGMVAGFVVSLFSFLFLHISESKVFGVAKLLFGKDSLLSGSSVFIDPLIFALPASVILTVVVSLATKVEDPNQVEKSFHGI